MVKIDHYSDLLCVWAYIAHVRAEELKAQFPDQLQWSWHYLPVFGDVHSKFETQWAERGGAAGYAAHVSDVVAGFPHIQLHADTWTKVQPASSAPSHLWLAAVRLASAAGDLAANAEAEFAWALRQAFFERAMNIGEQSVLATVAKQQQLDLAAIEQRLENGTAFAALCQDMQKARDANIRISPTYVFNEDRQRLTGNVGYRIIEANVRELLESPNQQQSWC